MGAGLEDKDEDQSEDMRSTGGAGGGAAAPVAFDDVPVSKSPKSSSSLSSSSSSAPPSSKSSASNNTFGSAFLGLDRATGFCSHTGGAGAAWTRGPGEGPMSTRLLVIKSMVDARTTRVRWIAGGWGGGCEEAVDLYKWSKEDGAGMFAGAATGWDGTCSCETGDAISKSPHPSSSSAVDVVLA